MSSQMFSTIEQVKSAMGDDGADVKEIKAEWLQYMQTGVVVEIHVRRWRATTRLTAEDLGLTDASDSEQSAVDELMNLGDKFLLPAEYLKEAASIESGARQNLKNHGFRTFWGQFIPETAWANFRRDDSEFERRYMDLRDRLYANWDAIKTEMLNKYAVAARVAFRRTVLLANAASWRENLFVDSFISKISDVLPSADAMYQSFGYEREMKYIPLPDMIQRSLTEAEQIKAEAESLRDESKLDYDLRRELRESIQKQKEEQIGGFMRDLVSQLQGVAYDAVTDVLETLQNNDSTVHPRSIVQLKNMVQKVSSLNFWNDPDLAAAIEKIKVEIEQPSKDRKTGDLKARLVDIATVTRSTLIGLGASPRSARGLGIDDIPTVPAVRAARLNLGVNVDEIAPLDGGRKSRPAE